MYLGFLFAYIYICIKRERLYCNEFARSDAYSDTYREIMLDLWKFNIYIYIYIFSHTIHVISFV